MVRPKGSKNAVRTKKTNVDYAYVSTVRGGTLALSASINTIELN